MGPGAGFCVGRAAGTVCADFTAGDSADVFTPRTVGGGALSGPAGSPRAVTASVPSSQNKDEASLTATTTASATWVEGDVVFEVADAPKDGTYTEVMLLSVDYVGDYYEVELVLPSRTDQNATLGEYSDSGKSGPGHPLDRRLIPGVHRATMRLELASAGSGKASIRLDGAAAFEFAVSPPQAKARQLGVQAGVVYVDSPHDPWAVRIHALAFSSGTL